MRLVFDIEANGLYDKATKIWCIVAKDIDSGEIFEWTRDEKPTKENSLLNFLKVLELSNEIVGHNILNYDVPLLKKLTGWEPPKNVKITDTLVMSRLGNPDRPKPPGYPGKSGPHSLDCWGYRVGKSKPHHEEWDVFSPAMLQRCREDVGINHLTYNCLSTELGSEQWQEALRIEHEMARIMTEQERHGILFNKEKANEYIEWLEAKIEEIDRVVIPQLPYELVKIGTGAITSPFLKIGGYTKRVEAWLKDNADVLENCDSSCVVGGPFTRVKFIPFNIGSIAKIKDYLLSAGWLPDTWNFSKTTGQITSPKLEGEFEGISGAIPLAVKERITWRHRKSQIEGWLGNLRADSRLPAGANPCGTNTGRMRHNTVVNIPKANADKKTGELIWDTDLQKDVFGTQMRSLFTVPEGYNLVGHDASGLELRMLAHYMNDQEYIDQILNGDIHEYNRIAAGLATRDQAKTFIYATLYGAGAGKIGSIIGGSAEDGENIKRKFFDSLPKLEKLVNSVKRASGKGYLKGLDGRNVVMRQGSDGRIQRSRALNTLLQHSGAIVMKQSCIGLTEAVKANNIKVFKVLDMHDEGQAEVWIPDTELYCDIAVKSIINAGTYFNLNIPLDGTAKVGKNMAETH
jgi:DNA polymerase I